jgi:hypothetical protein
LQNADADPHFNAWPATRLFLKKARENACAAAAALAAAAFFGLRMFSN